MQSPPANRTPILGIADQFPRAISRRMAAKTAASVDDRDAQRPAMRDGVGEPLLEGDAFLAGGEWCFHGSSETHLPRRRSFMISTEPPPIDITWSRDRCARPWRAAQVARVPPNTLHGLVGAEFPRSRVAGFFSMQIGLSRLLDPLSVPDQLEGRPRR